MIVSDQIELTPGSAGFVSFNRLICKAKFSSAIYLCSPEIRSEAFKIGLVLAIEAGTAHEAGAFFIAAYAMNTHDVPIKKALTKFAKDILKGCPPSYLVGHAINMAEVQCHVSASGAMWGALVLMQVLEAVGQGR